MPNQDTIQCFAQAVEIAGIAGTGVTLKAEEAMDVWGELQHLRQQCEQAIALLEECQTNGESGMANLYAWFTGEQAVIKQQPSYSLSDRVIAQHFCHERQQLRLGLCLLTELAQSLN